MSKAFQPSIAGAQSSTPSTVVTQSTYPDGPKGLEISLTDVADRIRKGRLDPRVRSWAIRTLRDAGNPQDFVAKAQALLDGLRAATIYVLDPTNAEYIQAAHETLCLDDKGFCFRGGDCFPEDTLLLRDDYELVPIRQIKVGDRIWGRNKWTTVLASTYKGILPIDVICCNNGSMVPLTADHKVYVARCEKHETNVYPCACQERRIDRLSVSELKEDDVLVQPERIAFGKSDLDPDRAYVEGLYVSDGWSEEYRFAISGQDGCPKEAQKKEVQKICETLGVKTRWARKAIVVNDPEWTLRMQQMGLHAPEKHLLSLNLGEAEAAQTLRGVMADSGANTNGPGRTFTSTSKALTIQTRILHRMFGISCSIRYIEKHGGLGKNPIWRLGVRVKERADGKTEKILRVKEVERGVAKVPCFDIQTEDHYVYLAEHDVTVSNCDDLTVALGSATSSVGMTTFVVGQSFNGGSSPSHVLIGVEDPAGTQYRIDPSSKFDVGKYHYASKEWWIDPMKEAKVTLSGVTHGKVHPADFVGVGAPDTSITEAAYTAVVTQLQVVYSSLSDASINLTTAVDQVERTRALTRPDMLFDPEPAGGPIQSLADFPSANGVWTASMSRVCRGLVATCQIFMSAIADALQGVRTIYLATTGGDIGIASNSSDAHLYQMLVQGATDSIIGIFVPGGTAGVTLFAGILSKLGNLLTPQQVQAAQAAQVAGTPTGVSAAPLVVAAWVIGGVVVTVSVCYVIVKLSQMAAAKAEADAQAQLVTFVAGCVASGKCTSAQAQTMLAQHDAAVVAEKQALAASDKSSLFSSDTLKSVSSVVMWAAIGGATIYGLILFGPVLRDLGEDLVAHHATKRLSPKEPT